LKSNQIATPYSNPTELNFSDVALSMYEESYIWQYQLFQIL